MARTKFATDKIAEILRTALEEYDVVYGFNVSEVKVATDLSEAGAQLIRNDYVTEVFIATSPSISSLNDIV